LIYDRVLGTSLSHSIEIKYRWFLNHSTIAARNDMSSGHDSPNDFKFKYIVLSISFKSKAQVTTKLLSSVLIFTSNEVDDSDLLLFRFCLLSACIFADTFVQSLSKLVDMSKDC